MLRPQLTPPTSPPPSRQVMSGIMYVALSYSPTDVAAHADALAPSLPLSSAFLSPVFTLQHRPVFRRVL